MTASAHTHEELLEALKDMLAPYAAISDAALARVKPGQIMPSLGKHSAATIIKARAALSRATGEQQIK